MYLVKHIHSNGVNNICFNRLLYRTNLLLLKIISCFYALWTVYVIWNIILMHLFDLVEVACAWKSTQNRLKPLNILQWHIGTLSLQVKRKTNMKGCKDRLRKTPTSPILKSGNRNHWQNIWEKLQISCKVVRYAKIPINNWNNKRKK